MSKEFKNIDELFKSTIGLGTSKAPAHVKGNVLAKIGSGSWWMFGAGLLLVTTIIAVIAVVNMPFDKGKTEYQTRKNVESTIIEHYTPSKEIVTTLKTTKKAAHKTSGIPINNEIIMPNDLGKTKLLTPINLTLNKPEKLLIEASKAHKKEEHVSDLKSRKNTPLSLNSKEVKVEKTELAAVESIKDAANFQEKKDNTNTLELNESNEIESLELLSNTEQHVQNDENNSSSAIVVAPTKSIDTSQLESTITSRNAEQEAVEQEIENITESEISSHIENNNERIDSNITDVEISFDPLKEKGYWMIGLKGGPNINGANYTSVEFTKPLDQLHNERLGYFGQIYGQYASDKGLVASVGIGIEKQSYSTTFLTTDTIYDLQSNTVISHYLYDSTNMITDTIFITTIDSTVLKNLKNHYGITNSQYLQIPFKFGCQVERNKWIFGADLGLQINYLLQSNGTYFLNNKVLPIDGSSIFKRTTILYSVGGNLKYNVFNNFYLATNIRYSPSFQNYYESTYAKRSISSFSFEFGLAYRW